MEITPKEVRYCQDSADREPFTEWLDEQEPRVQAIITRRLDRVEDGLMGDVSPVGAGVSEFRIDYGPGFRLYFGQIGSEIHLISGGTKRHQPRDIEAAKEFWREYVKEE